LKLSSSPRQQLSALVKIKFRRTEIQCDMAVRLRCCSQVSVEK